MRLTLKFFENSLDKGWKRGEVAGSFVGVTREDLLEGVVTGLATRFGRYWDAFEDDRQLGVDTWAR